VEVENEDQVALLKHNDLVGLVFSTDVLVGGDHELQMKGSEYMSVSIPVPDSVTAITEIC
jgi:hypothetical protein